MVGLSDFKKKLRSTAQFGLFQNLRDPQVAGLVARAGWDFLLIDTEHGAINPETVQNLVLAARLHGLRVLIRLKNTDRATVQTALETGVDGLLAPLCESPDEARQFVDVALYPPTGSRGFHGLTEASGFGATHAADYARRANSGILLGVQIETPRGLEACEDITRIKHLDLLFLGTGDLSMTMGRPGESDFPELRSALSRLCAATHAEKKIAGAYSSNAAFQEFALKEGVLFLACGADVAFLKTSAIAERDRLTAALKGYEVPNNDQP